MILNPNRTVFVFVLTLLLAYCAFAQCVRVKVKADALRGQTVFVTGAGGNTQTLSNVQIKLTKRLSDEREIVFDGSTDADGSFAAEVKPGKYVLAVIGPSHFDQIWTEINIIKASRSRSRSFLTVVLGLTNFTSTDSCEGTIEVSQRPYLTN